VLLAISVGSASCLGSIVQWLHDQNEVETNRSNQNWATVGANDSISCREDRPFIERYHDNSKGVAKVAYGKINSKALALS
jgi:hypothetical protein